MSDQRYTDALLANGRLREERDRLREALEWVGGTVGATDEWPDPETMIASVKKTAEDVVFERDRLREALEWIDRQGGLGYRVRDRIKAALAKEAGQ